MVDLRKLRHSEANFVKISGTTGDYWMIEGIISWFWNMEQRKKESLGLAGL